MNQKPTKTITPKRMKSLEESIGFLSNYKGSKEETHVVKESDVEIEDKTKLLKELGNINIRRQKIIDLLTK